MQVVHRGTQLLGPGLFKTGLPERGVSTHEWSATCVSGGRSCSWSSIHANGASAASALCSYEQSFMREQKRPLPKLPLCASGASCMSTKVPTICARGASQALSAHAQSSICANGRCAQLSLTHMELCAPAPATHTHLHWAGTPSRKGWGPLV